MRGIESSFGIEKAIIIEILALKKAPLENNFSNDDNFRGQNIKIGKILGADFT